MRRSAKLFLQLIVLLAGLSIFLLFSACGGGEPYITDNGDTGYEEPAAEEPADEPMEEAAEEPMEEPAASSGITLEIWLPDGILETSYLQSLFDQYTAIYGDEIELIVKPPSDFYNELDVNVPAGTAPDATLLRYNAMTFFIQMGGLQPIDLPGWDFVADAARSNIFEGNFYGVPWLRQGCSLVYLNLVAPWKDESQTGALFNLFEFLTSPEIQRDIQENDGTGRWYPTLDDESMMAGCSEEVNELAGLRVDPVDREKMYNTVFEQLVPLGESYGVSFNIRDSAGYREPENPEGFISSAAASDIYPASVASLTLQGDNYYYMGAFFSEMDYLLEDSGDTLPQGGYMVSCPQDPTTQQECILSSPNNGTFFVPPANASNTPDNGTPSAMFVEGSFKICWWLDSVRYCIKFGK